MNERRAADESFWDQSAAAARDGGRVLVLEKIAYGAGATRWYLIEEPAHVALVSGAVRHGSAIQIYIDPAVEVEGRATEAMLPALTP